ncbi:helicase, partial [Arthrospira platensis SPKY1]|nr:helicase [Arthrospira platensis SPKY1]
RLRAVLLRVYTAYMAAAQRLLEQYGATADPWMTLVGYFNSMRELGGMRRVVDDSVRTRLMRMDARGLSKRFIDPLSIEELTSRKGAADIPKILDRLEAGFSGAGETERSKDFARRPLDVVLATNMISVGVDVSR